MSPKTLREFAVGSEKGKPQHVKHGKPVRGKAKRGTR